MRHCKYGIFLLIVLIMLSSCSNRKNFEIISDSTATKVITTVRDNVLETDIPEVTVSVTNVVIATTHDNQSSLSAADHHEPDLNKLLQNMEAQKNGVGSAIFSSPKDTNSLNLTEYNGKDLEFYCSLSADLPNRDVDFAIGFVINGVYQDIKIERKGVISDYASQHIVSVPSGTTQIYKVFLKPNVGKAGDVVKFNQATIINPYDRVTSDTDWFRSGSLGLMYTSPIDIKMNIDSSDTANICSNYSNSTISDFHKDIKKYFNTINNTGEICQCLIYQDINKAISYDRYKNIEASEHINVTADSQTEINIALGGGRYGTIQRVCLYVNGQMMPVFDGKYYADVPIEYNKQTNLKVNLDTSNLNKWNSIMLTYYTIGEYPSYSTIIDQSKVYVLRVDR